MAKPGAPHMAAAKKVLRYLQGRKHIPITWCAASCRAPHKPGHVCGYADASFADVKPNKFNWLCLHAQQCSHLVEILSHTTASPQHRQGRARPPLHRHTRRGLPSKTVPRARLRATPAHHHLRGLPCLCRTQQGLRTSFAIDPSTSPSAGASGSSGPALKG